MKKAIRPKGIDSLTGVDLFAGAGGFSLAAKDVGIKIKAAIEMDSHACNTYKRNLIKHKRNPAKLFEDDINNIEFKKLMKNVDLRKQ